MSQKKTGTVARDVGARCRAPAILFRCWMIATPCLDEITFLNVPIGSDAMSGPTMTIRKEDL